MCLSRRPLGDRSIKHIGMTRCITLKDSQFVHGEVIQGELAGPALWAIDELHHSTITPLSLSSRKTEPISGEELLSYSITSTKDHHEQMVVHSARLFTSHYVGSFLTSASWGASQKRVMIQIEPRFGWNSRVFCRLLAHAEPGGVHQSKWWQGRDP